MNKLNSKQKLPNNRDDRETLRNKGQFWTPDWIAEAMIAYVTEDNDVVFDPATGRGVFFKALLKINKKNTKFFGLDIDEEVLSDEIYNNNKCLVEKKDFIKTPPNRKFKAIVANPPYIRHHRLDPETKLILRQLSTEIVGEPIDGRAGYHIYFLIQALNLLEKNGRLAFIMPADTCEGRFSQTLWRWISKNFCIEGVITFDEVATPFPNIDTNAIIFLIKNSKPQEFLHWVKVKRGCTSDLFDFISSNFSKRKSTTLEIFNRKLVEGLQTGLSRPPQTHEGFKFYLNDFATVIRGIATGSNEFFFLTAKQIKELGLPKEYFKRAIGRTRDITGGALTLKDLDLLEKNNRPTYLLDIQESANQLRPVQVYLKLGEKMGLPDRSLIRQRNPWYKMEQRKVPQLLFAYLGRRNARFIKNQAGVLPLTGFLCVYTMYNDKEYIENLWQALNHPDTLENLKLVGKSYGSGAIKVEPGNLNKLPIPEHIVTSFNLIRPHIDKNGQFEIFREPRKKYLAAPKKQSN